MSVSLWAGFLFFYFLLLSALLFCRSTCYPFFPIPNPPLPPPHLSFLFPNSFYLFLFYLSELFIIQQPTMPTRHPPKHPNTQTSKHPSTNAPFLFVSLLFDPHIIFFFFCDPSYTNKKD